ncbi:MAG: FAD-binding protein [Gammaproteobacteria bacterium]|nr:FAD-binding protein [Gammaproteobacteria bacterium]
MARTPVTPSAAPRRRRLLAELGAILPAEAIVHDPAELGPYECDGLTMHRQLPMLVALPTESGQVRDIVRLCAREGVPLVARGAGTSLSGGAMPLADGILLNLSKMNRILAIDADNLQAVAQPGVTNLALSEAAAPHGLFYAPDPSSQQACSIGGNVAENAGGIHCLKYGLTVHNLQRLQVVAADGAVLEIGARAPDAPGYDLAALLTGSEGMLGIVVEVTVKLLPKIAAARLMLVAFGELEDASGAVADIIAAGIVPAGLEMLDNPAIRAVEAFVHAGYPTDAAAILLCELDGDPADIERQCAAVREICGARRARGIETADDEAHRQRLWAGRKASFPAVGRLAPDYYCMDGTIPRRRLSEVLRRIAQLSEKYGLAVANVFHAGDGNLHPLIMYDANKPGEAGRVESFGEEILAACVAAGGTITGEHGVGVEKLNSMCGQFTRAELEQFHRLKAAFDPDGILNPGKAIPTLRRCAELGAMHVHGGRTAHPELPRF